MNDSLQLIHELKEENIRLEKENLEIMEKLKISQKKVKKNDKNIINKKDLES